MRPPLITRLSYFVRSHFPFVTELLYRLPRGIVLSDRHNRFRGKSMEEVFQEFFTENLWQHPESISGFNSSIAATGRIRAELPGLFRDLGVKTILDIPCGDFNWMAATELNVECYIGADIVEDLIAANRKRHTDERFLFEKLNIIEDPLPAVDLILCRDLFIHFPDAEIFQAIANIKASGATHLLTTTFTRISRNGNIPLGSFRPINLECSPFSFPNPIRVIEEGNEGRHMGRSLALWRITDIPAPNLELPSSIGRAPTGSLTRP